MMLFVPRKKCYIKSGDNFYRDGDTISITTPNKTSSVLLKIKRTGWGDYMTDVSLLDKRKLRPIIDMSTDTFIKLVEGYDSDYEVVHNEFFILDDYNNRINPGDTVISIYKKAYTLECMDIEQDRYLEDGCGSGNELVSKCTLTMVDDMGQIVLCRYTIHETEFSDDDTDIKYNLTDGPNIRAYL